MLLIPARIRKSNIHGYGLFACTKILKGTKIWEFNDIIDERFPINTEQDDFMKHFAIIPNNKDYVELCGDAMLFVNHSFNPNLIGEDEVYAAKDIEINEELTANYYTFDRNAESGGLLK